MNKLCILVAALLAVSAVESNPIRTSNKATFDTIVEASILIDRIHQVELSLPTDANVLERVKSFKLQYRNFMGDFEKAEKSDLSDEEGESKLAELKSKLSQMEKFVDETEELAEKSPVMEEGAEEARLEMKKKWHSEIDDLLQF